MVFRFLLIAIIIFSKASYSNVIYDKNNISITEIEINNYRKLYENNFGISLSKNKILKDIVLMKKTIYFLSSNKPKFMIDLDENIKSEYGEIIFEDLILLDFLRFKKIRNEFIIDYYYNKFSIQDFEMALSLSNNLKIPVSKNKCMTIESLHQINKDIYFLNNFLENLKKNQKDFNTKINNENYDVCMNNEIFFKIESLIISFIKNKTESEFNEFIYGKIN